jgi:hypothetical protein
MKRLSRHALPIIILATLTACGISIGFDASAHFTIDATAGPVSASKTVDLSQSSAVNDLQGTVEGLSIDSVDLSVSHFSAAQATHLTGQLTVRATDGPSDGSQDVVVGAIQDFALSEGATLHIGGNAAVDDFLLQQLKATKKFSIVITGQSDTAAQFELDMAVHLSVTVL